MTPVARLLVRAPNWVGDVVMATPLLRAARSAFPGARITVACRRSLRRVLEPTPRVDAVVELGAGLAATVRRVRAAGPFDLALVLPNSLRAALECRLAGIPRRIGHGGGLRAALLTEALPVLTEGPRKLRPVPMVDYYLRLLERAGAAGPFDRSPELFLGEATRARGQAYLERHGVRPGERLAGLIPGASFGPSKAWPAERFAQVADALADRLGLRPLVLAGPGEEAVSARIASLSHARAVDTGREVADLDLLKALVSRLQVVVTNDTGPRHYAAALGVPAVVVMGPTDPRYTEYGCPRMELVLERVECWPCHLKRCPIDHRCMTRIEPAAVVEAVARVLALDASASVPLPSGA
ncbi:MAG: lipopolysaccharide heptosyltransferase II [Planctomycetes bacterium]|nr:lipopolysaccharide heptosyltransferase II [Planctomycetota bacterium]